MTAQVTEALREALLKVRSYNVDIAAGRINYRPKDHIQVIDAALSAPHAAAAQWRPIETARLDGKPFLARYQWLGEHRFKVIRRSDKGPWWIVDGTSRVVGDVNDPVQFTHWQPIPSPPADYAGRKS
jgi:hypothetical protein